MRNFGIRDSFVKAFGMVLCTYTESCGVIPWFIHNLGKIILSFLYWREVPYQMPNPMKRRFHHS